MPQRSPHKPAVAAMRPYAAWPGGQSGAAPRATTWRLL